MKYRSAAGKVALALIAGAPAAFAIAGDLAHFTTVTDTDFAMFAYGGMSATGLAADGTGTITVSGVGGTVTRAVLVWHGPASSASETANAAVTFNGAPITGSSVGISDNNCWSNFANSRAYQADVTNLVPGNGAYALSNFVKGAYPNPVADVNGVSLLLFYADGIAANNRDIVVYLGNDSNRPNTFDSDGWNVKLNGVNYSSGTATLRLVVSDGQSIPDPETVWLNATAIFPGGQNFDGNTVPNGPAAGDPDINGGLWDHRATSITAQLTQGSNNLTLSTSGPTDDCLSLVATVFDLPVGAAPALVPVGIPTLSQWGLALLALLTGGLAAAHLRRRM